MEQKIFLEDNSGDKDCFTVIPNIVINHSSAIDQSLYLQLKRLAGDGKKDYCYPSIKYLLKQMKISKPTLKKSIKYLVEHKWIDELGKRQVHTAGGMQWVNAYRINNIWKLNSQEYKGGKNSTTLPKGGIKSAKGGLILPKGGTTPYAYKERIKNLKRKRNKLFISGQGVLKDFTS